MTEEQYEARQQVWETLVQLASLGALTAREEPVTEAALAAEAEKLRRMAEAIRPKTREETERRVREIMDEVGAAFAEPAVTEHGHA